MVEDLASSDAWTWQTEERGRGRCGWGGDADGAVCGSGGEMGTEGLGGGEGRFLMALGAGGGWDDGLIVYWEGA